MVCVGGPLRRALRALRALRRALRALRREGADGAAGVHQGRGGGIRSSRPTIRPGGQRGKRMGVRRVHFLTLPGAKIPKMPIKHVLKRFSMIHDSASSDRSGDQTVTAT